VFTKLNKKVALFIIIAIVALVILLILDYCLKIDYKDIIVEAHGLLMDIILFGILITLYESITGKKERIKDLKEQLEDFRQWEEKEATYRIIGIFKRLKQLGVKEIDLSLCFLQGAYFDDKFEMQGVNFSHTRMQNSRLNSVNFKNVVLFQAKLENCFMSNVDFTEANLKAVSFNNSKLLHNVKFNNANLENAELLKITYDKTTDLKGANLMGAFVDSNWFERIKAAEIIGIEEITEKYEIYKYGEHDLYSHRLRRKTT
jgi:uncharacterized protein YjbI with pentapeptide repeats